MSRATPDSHALLVRPAVGGRPGASRGRAAIALAPALPGGAAVDGALPGGAVVVGSPGALPGRAAVLA